MVATTDLAGHVDSREDDLGAGGRWLGQESADTEDLGRNGRGEGQVEGQAESAATTVLGGDGRGARARAPVAKKRRRPLREVDTPVSKRPKFVQTTIQEDGTVGKRKKPAKKVTRRRLSAIKPPAPPSTPLAVQTVFSYENAGGVWDNGR